MTADTQLDATTLTKALELVPQFVLIVDEGGRILYINHVEPGYDRDRVIGSHAAAIMSEQSRLVFEAALQSVFATGETEEYEVQTSAPDGSAQWYRSLMKPVISEGHVTAVVLVATNITELRTAQAEMEQLRGLLPICAWCGVIRNGQGEWEPFEKFASRELERGVTHTQCPACAQRNLAELDDVANPPDLTDRSAASDRRSVEAPRPRRADRRR